MSRESPPNMFSVPLFLAHTVNERLRKDCYGHDEYNNTIMRCVNNFHRLRRTLVNLRNRTGEERRRQTLCDKRDNNFA